jgi:hypothetical protein
MGRTIVNYYLHQEVRTKNEGEYGRRKSQSYSIIMIIGIKVDVVQIKLITTRKCNVNSLSDSTETEDNEYLRFAQPAANT